MNKHTPHTKDIRPGGPSVLQYLNNTLSSEEKRSFVSLAHESSDSNQYKRTISRANAINLLNHLQRNQVQTYKYYQLNA